MGRLCLSHRRAVEGFSWVEIRSDGVKFNTGRPSVSTVEDLRKVTQDFLAPELKVLAARLDAIETLMELRFSDFQRNVDQRFSNLDQKFKCGEDLASERPQVIMNALDLNRRLTQVETKLEKPNRSQSISNDKAACGLPFSFLNGFALEGGLLGVGEGVFCLDVGGVGAGGLGAGLGLGGLLAECLEFLCLGAEARDLDRAGLGDEIAHGEIFS